MDLRAVVVGDIKKAMDGYIRSRKRAAREAITQTGSWTRDQLRQQTRNAFARGARLANTWTSKVYPAGKETFRPAALVYSRAPQIAHAFSKGATIRPKGGKKYLTVATQENRVGTNRKPRVTPKQMVSSRMAFVIPVRGKQVKLWCLRVTRAQARSASGRVSNLAYAGGMVRVGGRGAVVRGQYLRRGAYTQRLLEQGFVPMFILIPYVRLAKRLDLARVAAEASRRLAREAASRFAEAR